MDAGHNLLWIPTILIRLWCNTKDSRVMYSESQRVTSSVLMFNSSAFSSLYIPPPYQSASTFLPPLFSPLSVTALPFPNDLCPLRFQSGLVVNYLHLGMGMQHAIALAYASLARVVSVFALEILSPIWYLIEAMLAIC
jgi:hypothetical protein